jgi:hypothetical protein
MKTYHFAAQDVFIRRRISSSGSLSYIHIVKESFRSFATKQRISPFWQSNYSAVHLTVDRHERNSSLANKILVCVQFCVTFMRVREQFSYSVIHSLRLIILFSGGWTCMMQSLSLKYFEFQDYWVWYVSFWIKGRKELLLPPGILHTTWIKFRWILWISKIFWISGHVPNWLGIRLLCCPDSDSEHQVLCASMFVLHFPIVMYSIYTLFVFVFLSCL